MPKFNENQKKIAVLLLHEAKTAEELREQLNIPYNELMQELKGMLKLEVISKEGFPTKYLLKKEIYNAVRKRKMIAETDKNKLRLRVTIEVQAIQVDLLKKQLKEIQETLRKEDVFTIYDIIEADPLEQGEHYSSYLDVNLSVKDFHALMRLMFLYGPTSVEVIKPEKLEFSSGELQDGLHLIADIVHSYTEYIASHLNQEELAEFNRKLYE
ncbi:hypothetical protein KKG83_00935 [Candidatus Micrarchaeota archaeon]|nr:hypothetical protein [Candidatus Micrarchaeota archaeon]